MTASEPKKIITKSKSKSVLDEKPNGAKKLMSKSRTQSTLKEVNTTIIASKIDNALSAKNSNKEESNPVEKKQKKSLGKSKTNTSLKSAENSINVLPVKSLTKSKSIGKFEIVVNSNGVVKSKVLASINEEISASETETKCTLAESKSSNGLQNLISRTKNGPQKSLAKSKTVVKLKAVAAAENSVDLLPVKSLSKSKTLVKFENVANSNSVLKSKSLASIHEEISANETPTKCKLAESKISNGLQDIIYGTKSVPKKSLAKSKTVAKLKTAKSSSNEQAIKSIRKCKSHVQLKDASENVAVIVDIKDHVDNQRSLHREQSFPLPDKGSPPKECLDNVVDSIIVSNLSNLTCETPKTVSKNHQERLKRLTFSDVSVFYFNRTMGHCSIPRDGGNTIGMDMKHHHLEKRRLFETSDPFVKRKLFSFQGSSSLMGKDLKEESEHVPMANCPRLISSNESHSINKQVVEKTSFIVDTDDFEISFKSAGKPKSSTAPVDELEKTQSGVEVVSVMDNTLDTENGLFLNACLSPEKVQLDFVPENNSLTQSPSFKRSLSLSISDDNLAFPWKPLRRTSISMDPPRKSQKPSEKSKTMSSSVTFSHLQPHLTYRSSPRLSNIKSTSSLLSDNLTTPKNGKISKRNDTLRKSAFRGSQSNGLSRAFSKVDFKLSEMAGEKTECLPTPGEEMLQSITRNCLRSFRTFSVSPESKVSQNDTEPEIHANTSKPSFHNSEMVLETPQNNTTPQGRGSNSNSKRSKKKGECGTRGMTPLNSKARFSLLKSYGILNIDKVEAEEIRNIRESREQCGCSCRGDCKPESCECAKNGIKCQVERLGFPCRCGVGCKNPHGRKVFDEMEVSLHFINTMMNMKGVLDISGSEDNLQNGQLS